MNGIPKPCPRVAARRPAYEPRGKCKCLVCAEYEQIEDVAQFHAEEGARLVAMAFLTVMEDIRVGKKPPYDLAKCFD